MKWLTAKLRLWLCGLLLFGMLPAAQAQVRSGASFLKILPGARVQGMGGIYTGLNDDLNALLANPAAAAYLREWQWTANYSRWIADVYRASLLYGRRLRTPWSQNTRVAVGVLYQGMPEFNSADPSAGTATASDILLIAGLGQRLTFLSPYLAFGANAKYFRSELDRYRASTWVFDAGLFYRSPVFAMPASFARLLPLSQITAGVAVTQMGRPLTFLERGTPLPRGLRAGVQMLLGRHRGWQVRLGTDAYKIRDEKWLWSVGAELIWDDWLLVRSGTVLNRDPAHLLNPFSFGVSFRLDDLRSRLLSGVPGRNSAMRLDLAAVPGEAVFSGTYRGTVNHFPIGPESFRLLEPTENALFETPSVVFQWEAAPDPDPFDRVHYWLLVDTLESRLQHIVTSVTQTPGRLDSVLSAASLVYQQRLQETWAALPHLNDGDYVWTALAVDRDGHVTPGRRDGRPLAHFAIVQSDLQITRIEHEPHPWITSDDYQGKIIVESVVSGRRVLKNVSFVLFDSTEYDLAHRGDVSNNTNGNATWETRIRIPQITPGDTLRLSFDWYTRHPGKHRFSAFIDADNEFTEPDESNNRLVADLYTIPKGTLTATDTATAVIFSHVTYDLPFIAEVSFDSSSAFVKNEYLRNGLLPAPLTILAERLKQFPETRVYIRGFIDPNSGETDLSLADRRSRAVRDSLLAMGVQSDQIDILPGQALKPRSVPRNRQDAIWLFQERRYAEIVARPDHEVKLFQPMRFTDIEALSVPITLIVELTSPVPLTDRQIYLEFGGQKDSIDLQLFDTGGQIFGMAGWRYPLKNESEWQNQTIQSWLAVTDSLGRRFRIKPKSIYLLSDAVLRDEKYAWPLKFAQTDPLYAFYWDKLFAHVTRMLEDENMRMRFVGHACAIGPRWVNQRLSERRAERFQNRFLDYVKENYPESYDRILQRLDPPIGRGENVPLFIQHASGRIIILGDNNSPLGRKLNRRIEIDFYSPERPLQETMTSERR